MYGLVNRAIKEHVLAAAGAQAWAEICLDAGLTDDHFVAMDPYDDAITYDLAASASKVLRAPVDEILVGFGRYWILYTGAEGWGPVLDMQGSSVAEVLGNLNSMHARLTSTMPSLVMPDFRVTRSDEDAIIFEYHSKREGLSPMVRGIVEGLAERCGERWDVTHTGHRAESGFDTFMLNAA